MLTPHTKDNILNTIKVAFSLETMERMCVHPDMAMLGGPSPPLLQNHSDAKFNELSEGK